MTINRRNQLCDVRMRPDDKWLHCVEGFAFICANPTPGPGVVVTTMAQGEYYLVPRHPAVRSTLHFISGMESLIVGVDPAAAQAQSLESREGMIRRELRRSLAMQIRTVPERVLHTLDMFFEGAPLYSAASESEDYYGIRLTMGLSLIHI